MPASTDNEPKTILLVDDNPTNIQILRACLSGLGHKLLVAKDGETAIKIVKRARPTLLLLDVMMPGIDGFTVCERIKSAPETAQTAVIFLTALDKVEDKVKGFRLGAVDFITKPFQAEEVLARVETQLTLQALQASVEAKNKALARELQIARRLSADAARRAEGPLVGKSPALQTLLGAIHEASFVDTNILLTGPPGAGYEAIARRIHHLSSRRDSTFFQINGLILKGDAAELLLPSLETNDPQTGEETRFGLADGGTIFLEHVQSIPMALQEQLFHYFQKLHTQRYESKYPQLPDVRLIASTDDVLPRLAREGHFYGPLIPYLSQAQIKVPGLRERRADISELAHFFLEQHSQELGKLFNTLGHRTLEDLKAYNWPGNVDELNNLLKRQVAIQSGPQLDIEERFLASGPTIGGYRLLEKLGVGGMGEVWRAQHQLLAYPAAVKVIRHTPGAQAQQETLLRRFQTEARITAYLQSPHTVKMYDFGITPQGEYYYVMELLQGMDLAQLIEEFGALAPARVIALLRLVCLSLAEAHEAGLIHRDLKPENIFMCRLGRQYDFPKVLDFGIAKRVSATPEESPRLATQTKVIGTPGYVPPEAMKSKGQALDHRFDLYSLGCVAYKALTGREVFSATTDIQRMVLHATKAPSKPSLLAPYTLPEGLDELVLQCLAKTPETRLSSADELYERLGAIQGPSPWTEQAARAWWEQYAPDAVKTHLEKDTTQGSGERHAMFVT